MWSLWLACAHPSPPPGACGGPPGGSRADAALAAGSRDLYGFRWHTAEVEPGRFEIRVEGPGARRRLVPTEAPDACGIRPLPDDPCDVIRMQDWYRELETTGRLQVYGDRVVVHDWRELDAAALLVAGTLRARRVVDPWVVVVEDIACVQLAGR